MERSRGPGVWFVHMSSDKGPFEVRSGKSLFDYYAARSDSNIEQ